MKVLVTGSAGFIGSYVCEQLLSNNHDVIALDNLDPQIHGEEAEWPEYMPESDKITNVIGDVRDRDLVRSLVEQVNAIIHLAAAVGVGQSMYKIEHYCSVSVMGTAILLEETLRVKDQIKKLVVASSMSIYGEGSYLNAAGELCYPNGRNTEDMQNGRWEIYDENDAEFKPIPVKEDKPLRPDSIYAVNKRDQEEMCLAFGKAYCIPTVAFRMFNVYGARQALSNPYTGVAAIFSSKILQGKAPMIFEDGNQRRDFVHVEDVARAYLYALEKESANGLALNLGSGNSVSVKEIAETLVTLLKRDDLSVEITGKFRDGDIRNCFADIELIKKKLDWSPNYEFTNGVKTMLPWLAAQEGVELSADSIKELMEQGLLK